MVIVILGILASTALPNFFDLSKDAKIAKLQGMAGAMRSGTQIIFSKAIIENKISGASSVVIDGATILLHSGYPVGVWRDSIRYIVNLDDVVYSSSQTDICDKEWCGIGYRTSIPSGVTTTSPGRMGKVYPYGYSYNEECGVYYVNHANGSAPEIGLETSDC
jgi:type II secretory pathway pseudopilin PulG